MRELKISPGENISDSINSLIKNSKYYNEQVFGVFNGTKMIVSPNSTREIIYQEFKNQRAKQDSEYVISKEYKQQQIKLEKEKLELQEKLNNTVIHQLPTYKTLKKDILMFLSEIQPATDYIGVEVPISEILEKLSELGYKRNVNCNQNFKKEDKDNVADYIIGQAIDQLIIIKCIHPSICIYVKSWLEKFDK